MKLNLGCGTRVPGGWVNVDYALGARFAKVPLFRWLNRRTGLFHLDYDERIHIHDLTRRLPWADASADAVYTSHTLEHLSREDGRRLLGECHRVLRPGGILRVVVPDLRHEVTEYLEGRTPADDLVERLGVLYGTGKKGIKRRLAPFYEFPHRCMYDRPRLVAILAETGFEASAREPFDSDIGDIRAVELEERTKHAAIVEGRKR